MNLLTRIKGIQFMPVAAFNCRPLADGRRPKVQRQNDSDRESHMVEGFPDEQPTTNIITCKRQEFNLLKPLEADRKFGTVSLATAGWLHRKSKGDWFHINATITEQDRRNEMLDLEGYLQRIQVMEPSITIDKMLLENLRANLDIRQLSLIQGDSLPSVYKNEHLIIAAETGCGKTLSYLLPIAQMILERKRQRRGTEEKRELNSPLAIILTPGRELATQIGEVTQKLCQDTGIRVETILGGRTKQIMRNPVFDDVDILVASIGAISKLISTGIYRIGHVRHLVLDEADTLLDESFLDKLSHLLRKFPFHRNHLQDDQNVGTQLIMVSATMPTNIDNALMQIIDTKTIMKVVSPNLHRLMSHVEQRFLRVNKSDRPAHLLTIIKKELDHRRPLIIFSNKTPTSDYISIFLTNNGIKCPSLNGDMLMKIRLGCFKMFQSGECDVLSTTDVGSRGLDTTRARHVINFDFPLHISDYIHRCGRIGRINHFERCLVTNLISSRREIDPVQRIEHAARVGGLLPNVDANIKGIIQRKMLQELRIAENSMRAVHQQQEAF